MNLKNYLKTWDGTLTENRMGRYVMLVQSVVILVLGIALATRTPVIEQIPPGLTDKGLLMADDANDAVRTAWGSFFADTLANVTPRTADFLDKKLGPFVAPNISSQVRDLVAAQAKQIKDEQVSIQFSATDVWRVPDTDTVVVTGEYTIHGIREAEKRTTRTFEFGIKIVNYRVVLTGIDVYEGPWRPTAEREKKAVAAARKAAEAQQTGN
ncbi:MULTISPECIES: TraE/TraK family type IV conjugative transfer system protein [unclassified Dyella]|uniref:TraE/TraK family type IV conjugative transfer system protein n=1 Tax=Dyella sp. ASV21 TaxID=2795114 RepID=UPI0018EB57FF|nr:MULTISPECIES: TraE/TraK family type IV conjugative transfer system protein [unclassified Dyella]